MRTITKTAAHLLLGIALAGAAACGGATGGATGPAQPPDDSHTPSIAATYTLTLVNGGSLPALLWYDDTAHPMDAEMYVLSGSIVLRDNGTFRTTSVSQLLIEGDGVHPGTDMVHTSINDGTYTVAPESGSAGGMLITFTGENGSVGTASYDPAGGTLLRQAMIPGAPGQPDISIVYFYHR